MKIIVDETGIKVDDKDLLDIGRLNTLLGETKGILEGLKDNPNYSCIKELTVKGFVNLEIAAKIINRLSENITETCTPSRKPIHNKKKPIFDVNKWGIDLTEYKEQPRRYKCPECNETHDFGNISGWGDNFPSDYDWAKKRPNERTGIGCICSNCGTLSTSQFSMEAITEVLKQIFEDIVDDGAAGRFPFLEITKMED